MLETGSLLVSGFSLSLRLPISLFLCCVLTLTRYFPLSLCMWFSQILLLLVESLIGLKISAAYTLVA